MYIQCMYSIIHGSCTVHVCTRIYIIMVLSVFLLQAMSGDVIVVHTAKVLPAGMHLYDCISGNAS